MELKVFQIWEQKFGICYGEINIVLPSPSSKLKLEHGSLKNVHTSFVRYIYIYKISVIFGFSQTFARLAVVF